MPRHRVIVAGLLAANAIAGVAAGDTHLTRDPFRKPDLAPVQEPEIIVTDEVIVEQPVELPELRAILHSPRTTLVNLDGKLVAVGADYHGYHVAAAGERDVVLHAGEQTYVVSMDSGKKDHARRSY